MFPASRAAVAARRLPVVALAASAGQRGPGATVLFTTTNQAYAAVPQVVDESYKERLPHVPLDFNDARAAFAAKSNVDLLRSWAVLSACQVPALVNNADSLLGWAHRVFGPWLVNGVMRQTFFKHFCAGESQVGIQPTLALLKRFGIGAILDYAAEDDVRTEEGPASRSEPHDTVIARTFDYESEAKCEHHTGVFLRNIQAAADAPGQGFAAIKVTALGKPALLERVSNALLALRSFFQEFDENGDNIVTRAEFAQVYERLFTDSSPERIEQLFHHLDPRSTGYVDYLEWSRLVQLEDLPAIVRYCRVPGRLFQASLTETELKLLRRMMRRLDDLADAAARLNVKLMVDAEHTYFQPAIDHAVLELQRKHNRQQAVIYNTYQCYLKDSEARLGLDMDRAERGGYCFGAKLVRGAYMFLERARAEELGQPSPILDTITDTHLNYDRCVKAVLERVVSQGAEVMVATHNQYSVEVAVAQMHALGLEPSTANVFFGQLLGMADPLSFVLGSSGYRAYKYVPWGRIEEVMPYLVRRAQENSTVMGGVQKEKQMLVGELRRRLRNSLLPSGKAGKGRVASGAA